MEIGFVTEETDYSVAEFFEKFHTDIPTVVKVNQGFQGYILEDTFSSGEILYIAAISKQRRVVAEVECGRGRFISIPDAFSENLCVVKRGKCGHESSLSELLRHNRLPLEVQFPPNNVIIMGGKRFSSNEIPKMKLLKKFEEIYLLGNLLTGGKLDKTVLHVPLYLSQVRLCLVTGMKCLSTKGWESYCSDLKMESRCIEYDLLFGNQCVAEFDNHDLHPDTKYEYIEPVKYDQILHLMQHWPECHFLHSYNETNAHLKKDKTNTETKKTTRIFRKSHDTRHGSRVSGHPSDSHHMEAYSPDFENEDLEKHGEDLEKHLEKHSSGLEKHLNKHSEDLEKHREKHSSSLEKHLEKHSSGLEKHLEKHSSGLEKHLEKHSEDFEKHLEKHNKDFVKE